MKIDFVDFNPHTPYKARYEYVVDYISHDFDLDLEDAFYLIQQLKHNRSSVVIYAESVIDFHIFEQKLCVQIDGNGFWYAENIDLKIAKDILRISYEGCVYFGKYKPDSTEEWDAYTL